MVVVVEEERWFRVEIGRDAGAFFSDLNFRFLLMHYIKEQEASHSLCFFFFSFGFLFEIFFPISLCGFRGDHHMII